MQREYKIGKFIETGTCYGSSSAWASDIFKEVCTIELSNELYSAAKERYKHKKNIHFLQGVSSEVLKDILSTESTPALFWLDAHWCGSTTAGENENCPLLDELRIILNSNTAHLILIDDAREMLALPPENIKNPHNLPSYRDVNDTLDSLGRRYSVVWRDVVISVPSDKEESLYEFIRTRGNFGFLVSADMFIRSVRYKYTKLKYYCYKILSAVCPLELFKRKFQRYKNLVG
jgi:hypothetical protein